ncbi:hypothetical protein MMC18_003829 [Xylographa bjoerkii]|nr:hypothetical protein [Xylographa bjoerkii]
MPVLWRQTCRLLNRAVNSKIYEMYTIDEIMLIQEPESSDLRTFLDPANASQPKAPYVKILSLDWRLGYKRNTGDAYVFDDNLGVIYQESLEQLQQAKSLQSLILRAGNFLEQCAMWNNDLGDRVAMAKPSSDLKLNMRVLDKLSGLQFLSIGNLLPGEGNGLGLALKELTISKT